MPTSLAAAARILVRREELTVFERVIRPERRSLLRTALSAATAGAIALGLFGRAVVLPAFTGGGASDARRAVIAAWIEGGTFVEESELGGGWQIFDDYAHASVLSNELLAIGCASLVLLGYRSLRSLRRRGLSAGNTAVDEIPSDALSSVEVVATRGDSIELCNPDQMTGTLERRGADLHYRSDAAGLAGAFEATLRGPVIRLRVGDRLRARIGDLTLDVEGLAKPAA